MCIFSKSLMGVAGPSVQSNTSNLVAERHEETMEDLLFALGVSRVKFDFTFGLKGWKGAASLGAGGAVGTGAAAAGTAAGFTSSGIAAGSIAAAWQASIGNVVAGSTFAGLQSLGAVGGFALFGPVMAVVGGVTAVGAGAGVAGFEGYKHYRAKQAFRRTPLLLLHV